MKHAHQQHSRRLACAVALWVSMASGFGWAEPAPRPTTADFAALPAVVDASVSPDGTKVVMLRPVKGTLTPVVLDVGTGRLKAVLGIDPKLMTVERCLWISDTRLMCMTVAPAVGGLGASASIGPAGAEFVGVLRRYVAVNADGSDATAIGPPKNAELVSSLPDDDGHVLVAVSPPGNYTQAGILRNYRRGDRVELFDVHSDESELVQSATLQTYGWIADDSGELRVSVGEWNDRYLLRSNFGDAATGRRPLIVWNSRHFMIQPLLFGDMVDVPFTAPDGEFPRIVHVGTDGRALIESRQDSELMALYALDLRTGSVLREVHRAARVDVLSNAVAAPGAPPIGVRIAGDDLFFLPLNEEGTRIRDELATALPGRVNIPYSLSRDGSRLTVESISPGAGSSWYFYDRTARKLALIGHEYAALQTAPVAEAERLVVAARDGRSIPALLIRGTGMSGPGPLVVMPEPSPLTRDAGGFDPLAASIARMGISVLKVGYRGVFGYGQAHQLAGAHQWGSGIDADVADAVDELVARKVADPGRVCELGVAFAGHLALGAARDPARRIRCALSIGGFASLRDLIQEYGLRDLSFADREVFPFALGDREREAQLSHDLHAGEFVAPVFIAHGALDRQLLYRQSERMAAVLAQAGKDVTYLPLPTSSSVYAYAPERVQLYEAIAAFLRKHLL